MRVVNAPRYLSFLLVFPLLAFAGCGETEERADVEVEAQDETAVAALGDQEVDPLAGEYMMPSGARAVLGDGSYTVYEGDDVIVVGNYSYEGDQVIFVDSEGPMACPDMPGVYTLAIEAGEPQLFVVEDECEGRRRDITGEGAEVGEQEGEDREDHDDH